MGSNPFLLGHWVWLLCPVIENPLLASLVQTGPVVHPLSKITMSELSINLTFLVRVIPAHLGKHSSAIQVLPSPPGKQLVIRSF